MSIVSSIIAKDITTPSGRRWILEIHTDNLGIVYEVWYSAPNAQFGTAGPLATHAANLAADIASAEVALNIAGVLLQGSLAVPIFQYSTVAQNVAGLRAAYLTATKQDVIMIGDFLNSLTNAQLQTAFSMTAGQVTTLRTNKLVPAANLAASIRTTVGQ